MEWWMNRCRSGIMTRFLLFGRDFRVSCTTELTLAQNSFSFLFFFSLSFHLGFASEFRNSVILFSNLFAK